MTANELRIGNYLGIISCIDNNLYTHQVWKFDNSQNLINGVDIEKFRQIHITEEWLLKFGFKKIKNEPSQWFKIKTKKIGVNLEISLKQKRAILFTNEYECYSDCIYPKYVHQLQNLYFALTNEELKINI